MALKPTTEFLKNLKKKCLLCRSILGQFIWNLDTKTILLTAHWKLKIIPPPILDLINHPFNICLLHKLSYCLGVYSIYTRNKIFLNVFLFFILDTLQSNLWLAVCLLGCFMTYPKQYLSNGIYIICGLWVYSQLSQSGHHCKADTSLSRTWFAGSDWIKFLLFFCNKTLNKVDTP